MINFELLCSLTFSVVVLMKIYESTDIWCDSTCICFALSLLITPPNNWRNQDRGIARKSILNIIMNYLCRKVCDQVIEQYIQDENNALTLTIHALTALSSAKLQLNSENRLISWKIIFLANSSEENDVLGA